MSSFVVAIVGVVCCCCGVVAVVVVVGVIHGVVRFHGCCFFVDVACC